VDDPDPALTADTRDEERPDFEALSSPGEVVGGGRTREDFLDAVLGLDGPATVGTVADRAGHGVDAAREYLAWFERMGIVRKVTDSPATYERNRAYLDWRRVETLRTEYTTEELVDFLETESERAATLADEFAADAPGDVSTATVASETGRSVEAVWEDVSAWATARRRVTLLERALTTDAADAADRSPAV
jgi:hypothetical protein